MTRRDPVEVTLIIPTRNRPVQLAQVLRAVSQTTFPLQSLEVIVVADGRGQGLEKVVDACEIPAQLRLIEQDQQGPGAARNTGAARARGRRLVFTDDDCLPSPQWLGEMHLAIDRSPHALIGGLTTNSLANNVFSETSQLIHHIVYRHYNRDAAQAKFLASNNLAVSAEDFAAVGGFDPSFRTASEDREFCDRWLWSGRQMVYQESALVYHAHALTLGAFVTQHFRYGRGAAKFHQTRAQRGSGKFSEHLSFHRDLRNWLMPPVTGGLLRQAQVRSLLFVWQAANATGFLWEKLSQSVSRRN